MSVNFSSFSRSSFFSWSTISASASVHSHSLFGMKQGGRKVEGGGHLDSHRSPTHILWSYKHRFTQESKSPEGKLESQKKTGRFDMTVGRGQGDVGHLRQQLVPN